tara:strand:- start:244 stop:600 length:357 start_codon:yes stop_codon:yes gene_type:complete
MNIGALPQSASNASTTTRRTANMDDLREVIALALLNDDRKAGGWPEVKSRETIPNSEGYPRNADAALAAIKQAGFVVVRAVPTEAMVEAGDAAFYDDDGSESLARTYRAMIEASNAPT